MLESLYGFLAMLALVLLARMPIAFAMGLVGFVGFGLVTSWNASLAMATIITYETAINYGLSVVPLFILMGNFVTRAGLSDELYTAAHAFLGHRRGGLAMATIVACGGFSAVRGSSLATAATMSKVALPPMRRFGYSDALARCYGSIKQMDDQIGRLLAGLRDAGQEENTIVLFMSDNGPAEENRSVWTNNKVKGKRRSADWKLRNPLGLTGQKAEVWENGIRSPLLVRWPGKIAPGVREETIMVEDILPTLLDLAGVPEGRQPKHLPFDGKSIRGSLEDPTFTEERDIFRLALAGPGCPATTTPTLIIEDARETDYSKLHTVLRRGRYKFHHLPGGEVRLYDMVNDPAEKNDLSRQMPERTEELAQRCRARWDDIASRNRTFPMRQL